MGSLRGVGLRDPWVIQATSASRGLYGPGEIRFSVSAESPTPLHLTMRRNSVSVPDRGPPGTRSTGRATMSRFYPPILGG